MRFLPSVLFFLLYAAALAGAVPGGLPDDARETDKRARECFEHGRFSDAEELYEQIVNRYPDNLYALSNLGVALFRIGKLDLAKDALQQATNIAPGDFFAHYTLGVVFYQQRFYDQAMVEVAKALAIDPMNRNARAFLNLIQNVARLSESPPLGDFDTLHERLLRQAPGLSSPVGEIGLSPSAF